MNIKRLILILGLLIVGFSVKAHDPNLCYTSIFQDKATGQWKISISFGTYGLVKAMQVHFNDSSITMNPSMEFRNKAEQFIKETVNVRINKHFEPEFIHFRPVFDTHASELEFDLKDVPDFIAYWESSIQCLSKIPDPHNQLSVLHRLQIKDAFDLMKLDYTNGFQCTYLLMNDGKMRQVLN